MLLQVYFLSFLLCFNIIFCYEYKQENYNSKHINRRYRNNEKNRFRNHRRLHSGSDVDEPLAQIDLASFIRTPEEQIESSQTLDGLKSNSDSHDYENLDAIESMLHKNIEGLQTSNDVELDSKLNLRNVDADNSNVKHQKIGDLKKNKNKGDSMDARELTGKDQMKRSNDLIKNNIDDYSLDKNFRRDPEKKSIFKIKIPFFSCKSNTSKKKENRRRRLFGFKMHKKHSTTSTIATTLISNMGRNIPRKYSQKLSKSKRSYFENLCPSCRRKYVIAINNNNEENEDNCRSRMARDKGYDTNYDVLKEDEEK